ncbi:MAG: hypothetical protein UT24_C0019G0023 [Candidatus Woesebacteria bacterium GW2011_GWB1_39_12]|uniref:Uncharacterized protein n=1 Tax=Candidatus Woesebacteria bacterium GW2011_GWB1_39_12 TaxID=1618574 RepID=A0A0G0M752_9BACT|nr:MAG: hypothetical protein UT24_C0019G0023 [Candidatus Woesebacteria bacterium GW2011_GWB1_39_12]
MKMIIETELQSIEMEMEIVDNEIVLVDSLSGETLSSIRIDDILNEDKQTIEGYSVYFSTEVPTGTPMMAKMEYTESVQVDHVG